jgi:peptidase E
VVKSRRIVALGGYSDDIDHWIVELIAKDRPKVCFIPTASNDDIGAISSFYRKFAGWGCIVSCLTLHRSRVDDIEALLLDQDIIYVGGGNTADMLETWREHGVDKALKKAWEAGVLLAGVSAGAICWFETGVSDSTGRTDILSGALGFLPGCCSPHYFYPARKFVLELAVMQGRVATGIGIEDGAAACYSGTKLAKVVSVGGARVHCLDVDERGELRQVEFTA